VGDCPHNIFGDWGLSKRNKKIKLLSAVAASNLKKKNNLLQCSVLIIDAM
jgi:hypothetical protein